MPWPWWIFGLKCLKKNWNFAESGSPFLEGSLTLGWLLIERRDWWQGNWRDDNGEEGDCGGGMTKSESCLSGPPFIPIPRNGFLMRRWFRATEVEVVVGGSVGSNTANGFCWILLERRSEANFLPHSRLSSKLKYFYFHSVRFPASFPFTAFSKEALYFSPSVILYHRRFAIPLSHLRSLPAVVLLKWTVSFLFFSSTLPSVGIIIYRISNTQNVNFHFVQLNSNHHHQSAELLFFNHFHYWNQRLHIWGNGILFISTLYTHCFSVPYKNTPRSN